MRSKRRRVLRRSVRKNTRKNTRRRNTRRRNTRRSVRRSTRRSIKRSRKNIIQSGGGVWKCPTCKTINKDSLNKCVHCSYKKADRPSLNASPRKASPGKASPGKADSKRVAFYENMKTTEIVEKPPGEDQETSDPPSPGKGKKGKKSGKVDLKKRKKKRKIYPAYIFNDLETKYPDIMILKLYLARDSKKPKFISLFKDLVTEGVIGDVAVEKAEEYYAADRCTAKPLAFGGLAEAWRAGTAGTAGIGESCSCKKCFLKKEVLEIIDSIHTKKKTEEDKLKEEYEAQVAELKAELESRGRGDLIDVVLKVMVRVRIPAGEWLTEIMGMESDGTLKQFLDLCKARALAEAS